MSDTKKPPVMTDHHNVGGLLDASMVSLAREIAQDILPLEDILKAHGYRGHDDPRWLALAATPEFGKMLVMSTKEWNAADSTVHRVRVKAAAAMEVGLPALHDILHDTSINPEARIKAAEQIRKWAGVDSAAGQQPGGGGSGFSVTINMGSGRSISVSAGPKLPQPTGNDPFSDFDGLGEDSESTVIDHEEA